MEENELLYPFCLINITFEEDTRVERALPALLAPAMLSAIPTVSTFMGKLLRNRISKLGQMRNSPFNHNLLVNFVKKSFVTTALKNSPEP